MKSLEKEAIIVTGLSFGDEGKGSIVDYLTRETAAKVVVRFNGGAQAAHNVVTPDGRHHTFSQFGSGTFVDGTRTHLSRFMLTNPLLLLAENTQLNQLGISDALTRVTIDQDSLVTTPFHQAMNQLREIARGEGRHGSCGYGIGETMSDSLKHGEDVLSVGDLRNPAILRKKLCFLQAIKTEQLTEIQDHLPVNATVEKNTRQITSPFMIDALVDDYFDFSQRVTITDAADFKKLLESGTVIFEGAQGTLLDEWYGFHPFTTWSTTTFENALTLLKELEYPEKVTKLGLFRAYSTRHGAGPLITENPELTKAIPDPHNQTNNWQREFRVGYFDLVMAKYALAVCNQADALAVTCLDRLMELPQWQVAPSYGNQASSNVLEKYFIIQAGKIVGIRRKPVTEDLDYQAELTQLVQNCKPEYRAFTPRKTDEYLDYLTDQLGVPITITSAGLRATDKRRYHHGRKI